MVNPKTNSHLIRNNDPSPLAKFPNLASLEGLIPFLKAYIALTGP